MDNYRGKPNAEAERNLTEPGEHRALGIRSAENSAQYQVKHCRNISGWSVSLVPLKDLHPAFSTILGVYTCYIVI